MRLRLAVGVAGSLVLGAASAAAAPFDISTTGLWLSTVPNIGAVITPAPNTPNPPYGFVPNAPPPVGGFVPGSSLVNWGIVLPDLVNNPNSLPSGYRYEPINQTNIANITDPNGFIIGAFKHINYTIQLDSTITQATLQIQVTVANLGAGNGQAVQNFQFTFNHNETPNFPGNTGDPCPFTPSILQGVAGPGLLGCPDVVTFNSALPDTMIEIEPGVFKTLKILGFVADNDNNGIGDGVPDNNTVLSQFITRESTVNNALLLVSFVDPPPEVAAPAGLGLIGFGLLALYRVTRRQRCV